MSQRPLTEVPAFIRSKSPEGLRRKMLQNNAKLRLTNHYFDLQYVNGDWYAWFYKNEPNMSAVSNLESAAVAER